MKLKSIPIAVLLTALLGPFGMMYVSVSKAVLALLAWVVVIPFTFTHNPPGAILLAGVFWLYCVWESWLMATDHNAGIRRLAAIELARHRELLEALAGHRRENRGI